MSEKIIKNPFCVISKELQGGMHDIQTNSGWTENPYGEEYAVVPDEMVQDIMATQGFCDIELNDDNTEVVSFTAREIPEIEEPIPEPTDENLTTDELAMAILEGVNEV